MKTANWYNASLTQLFDDLAATQNAPAESTKIRALAESLINGAIQLDLARAAQADTHFSFGSVTRTPDAPVFVENDNIRGASWADDPAAPLRANEHWNTGRRATNTGIAYQLNAQGKPENPYINTGLHGRGTLGAYGPNHAVDLGMMMLQPDENGRSHFYILGIERKHDQNAPAFAGGFVEGDDITQTRTKEFFEEMISGSVPLDDANIPRAQTATDAEVAKRERAMQNGRTLPQHQIDEIREQIETALKLEQVQHNDPAFWNRLRTLVQSAMPAYCGPVIADPRNTNTSWIETDLAWIEIDDTTIAQLRGDHPAYDYALTAGDDASDILCHELSGDLIDRAYASHGPFFVYVAASYLLHKIRQGETVSPDVIQQCEDIDAYLAAETAGNPATPAPSQYTPHITP